MQEAVSREARMEKAKGKAKAFQKKLGGTVFKGNTRSQRDGQNSALGRKVGNLGASSQGGIQYMARFCIFVYYYCLLFIIIVTIC